MGVFPLFINYEENNQETNIHINVINFIDSLQTTVCQNMLERPQIIENLQ